MEIQFGALIENDDIKIPIRTQGNLIFSFDNGASAAATESCHIALFRDSSLSLSLSGRLNCRMFFRKFSTDQLFQIKLHDLDSIWHNGEAI